MDVMLGRIFGHMQKCLLSRRWSSTVTAVAADIQRELGAIKEAGTYKRERTIQGRQGVLIQVKESQRPLLNFCANNYLGLSSHPEVVEAAKEAVESHGAGLSSVRFICGTQDIHLKLERQIATFHRRDDAILYPACYDANSGIFEVFLGKEDAILSDELNHASMIDGIRLCKADRHPYKHLDLGDLEEKLKKTQKCRRRMIATDGVFSMDGDVAPLKELCDLAERYSALVMVDDCHATGFFGPTGRGTEEFTGAMGRVSLINSTLGKAMGGAMGGYTTGPRPFIDLLRQRSRPYLFSNSLAPAVVGSASKVYELLTDNPNFAKDLLGKTELFRQRMTKLGFRVAGDPKHPICPVMIGDAKLASDFAELMLQEGIYVVGFSYPVVPKGKARIRVQISAAHSAADIQLCVDAFGKIGKKLGVV